MADRRKIVLIDGHALVYRAYFALPPDMATSRGELTNAVFGVVSMLLNVYRDEKPDYMAIAWDVGRTFRHDAYDEYKANRAHMPDALSIQFERIHQLMGAFHIPAYSADGYEADDVLAALANQAKEQGLDVLIVTGDTDTFQLIDPHVRVMAPRRSFGDTVVYDEPAIRERYGLEPKQLIDYKGLTGDSSDNVPGVKGIGDKTATSLLQEYGSVEAIYQHLDEIKSARFRKALEEGRDIALLSKRLVTITDEVPVELDLEAARVREMDREAVVELFRQLEFRTLLNRLPEQAHPPEQVHPPEPAHVPEPSAPHGQQLSLFGDEPTAEKEGAGPAGEGESAQAEGGAAEYQVVDTEEALDRMVARLKGAEALVVDVESTSIDPMAAELVGIALASEEGRAYYVPVGHREGQCLPLPMVRQKLGPVLSDPGIAKIAHNANYDLTVLAEHGMEVGPVVCDTMVAEWIINPESRALGLKAMAWTRLGLEMTPIEDLIGSGVRQTTMDYVPIGLAQPYACADADMTLRLARLLQPELHEKALWELFADVEMPLVPVIVDMQRAGIKVDVAVLNELGRQLGQRMEEIQVQVDNTVGHPVNINSTQQLSVALFDEMGLALPWMRRGKSGHYSTAADMLDKIREKHPVVELIIEYRQLAKLKGTYVDALPALVNKRTGRIHTSFNQAGSATGRFSSSNPNLQNIPIRTELGREIRRAFVAEEGYVLLAADYSQVELRVLAHISQDPEMLAAFARGEDIHASTAAALYGVPLAEVTYDQRRIAKMTNFAISYGVTGYGLADRTGLPPEEASAFIDRYFHTFSRIAAYIESTRNLAREQGYVETLLGRRRYFPQLSTTTRVHQNVREQAYRMAINAPIQGTAADILKVALYRLWRALKERELRSRMILQVHDEVVLEVPPEELDEVAALTVEIMENAYRLDAPLQVDVKVGRNWLDMEEYRGEKGHAAR